MSFFSQPRAGSVLTAAGLAAILSGCKGAEPIGPDKKVAFIEIEPKSALLYTVGQTRQFSAVLTTEAGTAGEGIEIGYLSKDPSLVTVNSQGLATVKAKGGSTYILATAGGKSDSALVEVPTTTCGSVAATAMAVGQVVTDIGETGFCAAASTSEFTVIVHNNSIAAVGSSTVELSAVGVGAPPASSMASLTKVASSSPMLQPPRLRRDVAAERRHRRNEALEAERFVAAARTWYANRKRANFASVVPAVGDAMTINVAINGASGCNDARVDISARVAAVSNRAIVLADPNNPAGGYTDAEYLDFAQMFDSVIYPLDVAQFGEPTDLDANQRVLLVFTRKVNERTTAGSGFYVGGLTHSRDLLPKAGSGTSPVCPGSNEAEMFYLLVPDPNGAVNGVTFSKAFVSSVTDATIGHEFQHLINFARKRYLIGGTPLPAEELWLNEGLSHVAEELLYYRRSGRASRMNTGPTVIQDTAAFNRFAYYMAGNFLNYDEYAFAPTVTSPFESGDDVATRGATWSFLRYVADQTLTADGTLWYDLVNSGDAGLTNLQNRLSTNAAGIRAHLRDFTIAVYADDWVTAIAAKYTHPSWNMRAVYPGLNQNPPFLWPLATTAISDGEMTAANVQAGAFKVYRFRGLGGTDSFIRMRGASGSALPAGMIMSVIRTQ